MPCTPFRYLPHALLSVGMHSPSFWKIGHMSFFSISEILKSKCLIPKVQKRNYGVYYCYVCGCQNMWTWEFTMLAFTMISALKQAFSQMTRRCDSWICVTQSNHVCDVPCSCVCHDWCICVIWLICVIVHACDTSHERHQFMSDSLVCLFHMSHDSFMCVTWLIQMCHITHSPVSNDSFKRVTWPTHMCHVTHSYESHASYTCVTWMSHDSYICIAWLIHMYHMSHSYASHDSFIGVVFFTSGNHSQCCKFVGGNTLFPSRRDSQFYTQSQSTFLFHYTWVGSMWGW